VNKLTEEEAILVHAKLHNAIYFKKPFAPFEKIKELHDRIITKLKFHVPFDKLDIKVSGG